MIRLRYPINAHDVLTGDLNLIDVTVGVQARDSTVSLLGIALNTDLNIVFDKYFLLSMIWEIILQTFQNYSKSPQMHTHDEVVT